ncbi:HAMP domain-containing sensor histidine kinase [Pseudomonas sp. dw_358]|uniref:sensor histidine kinase n=1 Tax=Pseudomonas sp. dw_358 TaxID=2720083 RepID=UPI001BD56329|nr:HAMP domain-containing sensor histidine kinase [Pseudomonas sp. dw_358]
MAEPRRFSLGRRLILSYGLVSLLTGVLVLAVSNFSLDHLEVRLQEIDMGIAIERVRTEVAGGGPGRPGRFFVGTPGAAVFPEDLRALTPGFYKMMRGARLWHVRVMDDGPQRFLLMRDYTDYEHGQSTQLLLGIISVGGLVLLAAALGLISVRRLVRPIERLATRMTERAELPPSSRLAGDFPANEIGTVAQAFDDTYNHLEQALQRERLFTADVGHELRTPMMAALSTCEVLRDEEALSAEASARLARLEASIQDMRQRLDTYLMLARDDDCLGFAHATLAATAEEQVAHWQPAFQRQRLNLNLQHLEAPPDPGRYPVPLLRTVLGNLLRNALQYAGRDSRVWVRTGAHWLEVEDNGPGVPADQQQAIFQPFIRGDQPGEANLGLGLSLVRRICVHQGWTVRVNSPEGGPTRFRVECGVPINSQDR